MQIANGRIMEQNAVFQRHDIILKEGRVAEITAPYNKESGESLVIDAEGGYVIPGLIDLCARPDSSLEDTADILAGQGVTRFLAALPWRGEAPVAEAMAAFAPMAGAETGSALLEGFRLEGPFLAPKQAENLLAGPWETPDTALFERLADAAQGALKIMDVSPELPGMPAFIRAMSPRCRMSLGYTAAGYDQARAALSLGAKQISGLEEMLGQATAADPGALAAAVEMAEHVELCLNTPGLHPAAVRLMFQIFGSDRVCMVSRSNGKKATSLADCLRTASWFGVPLIQAIRAVTINPARALGIDGETGSIETGKRADVAVLDLHDLSLRTVVIGGELVYDKHEAMRLGG